MDRETTWRKVACLSKGTNRWRGLNPYQQIWFQILLFFTLSLLQTSRQNSMAVKKWSCATERSYRYFRIASPTTGTRLLEIIIICHNQECRAGHFVGVTKGCSLRKQPFLLALRRWGRFVRRNVCDLAAQIPY